MSRTNWTRAEFAACSILPELVSGRGTARRSRVVEGQTRRRFGQDRTEDPIRIFEHVSSRNSKRVDTGFAQPFIANGIPLRSISEGMAFTIDFDCKPSVAAEKVQDVGARRMLASEFQTLRSLTKPMPNDHFGQRHFATQASRVCRRAFARLGRNIFQRRAGPSTMLRMVSLPETSSGRI